MLVTQLFSKLVKLHVENDFKKKKKSLFWVSSEIPVAEIDNKVQWQEEGDKA